MAWCSDHVAAFIMHGSFVQDLSSPLNLAPGLASWTCIPPTHWWADAGAAVQCYAAVLWWPCSLFLETGLVACNIWALVQGDQWICWHFLLVCWPMCCTTVFADQEYIINIIITHLFEGCCPRGGLGTPEIRPNALGEAGPCATVCTATGVKVLLFRQFKGMTFEASADRSMERPGLSELLH